MPETFDEVTEKVFGPDSLDSLAEENPVMHVDAVIEMFDELGLLELREVVDAAQQKLEEREIAELAAARDMVKEMAVKLNVSPDELLSNPKAKSGKPNGGTSGDKKTSKAITGYRNPNDPNKVWSGKGRPPGWFQASLDAGITRESMRI